MDFQQQLGNTTLNYRRKMRIILKLILLSSLALILNIGKTHSLKHHLVLKDDKRVHLGVSTFGYLMGGRLDVIVQNLTMSPDPMQSDDQFNQFGFWLLKLDQSKDRLQLNNYQTPRSCLLTRPGTFEGSNLVIMRLEPKSNQMSVRCLGSNIPSIRLLPHNSRADAPESAHGSYKHTYNRRSAISNNNNNNNNSNSSTIIDTLALPPEMRDPAESSRVAESTTCPHTQNIPLTTHTDSTGSHSYSFNFSFLFLKEQEGLYYLVFHNCKGLTVAHRQDLSSFNLSMLIYETNLPNNYLSAGVMPLPQMYFMLSVMFFLIGCIWLNLVIRQKQNAFKIHYLMMVLVFAKALSLLFHSINYHYIALDGQPVVTWAYLYYATRSVKGALFFITLVLIGTGWSFIKHILSERDKKLILTVVVFQVVAHIGEIMFDQSVEGERNNEFWWELCSMFDLTCCILILYPITWSMRHLEEASRTDGKAAINLKKLRVFNRFYIVSTVYIYVTRIMAFILPAMMSFRYSWLAEFVFEFSTVVYFIFTGYYFQPKPTNPYLLLSNETDDLKEEVLFSKDSVELRVGSMRTSNNDAAIQDREVLLSDRDQTVVRRSVEEIA